MHTEDDLKRLLLEAYIKVLRVNLTTDSYEEIKVRDAERDAAQGYAPTISGWLQGFAEAGMVYAEDLPRYNVSTDLETLRRTFRHGDERASVLYRRKNESGAFGWVRMTFLRSYDYRDDHQIVMLYVEDVHEVINMTFEIAEERHITRSLVDRYFTSLYVDMDDNYYRRLHVTEGYRPWVPESGDMMDIMNVYLEQVLVPEDLDAYMENFSKDRISELLQRENYCEYEYWAVTAQGRRIRCRIVATLVDRHVDRTPHHVVMSIQDVTEQNEISQ